MSEPAETAIIVTVPDGARQVLVRIEPPVESQDVTVDFRTDRQGVWTPSGFFPDAVEVRQQ